MSLKCPECKAKLLITDSRQRPDNTCYRRYKCTCGFTGSTEERFSHTLTSSEAAALLNKHKESIAIAIEGITGILRGKIK